MRVESLSLVSFLPIPAAQSIYFTFILDPNPDRTLSSYRRVHQLSGYEGSRRPTALVHQACATFITGETAHVFSGTASNAPWSAKINLMTSITGAPPLPLAPPQQHVCSAVLSRSRVGLGSTLTAVSTLPLEMGLHHASCTWCAFVPPFLFFLSCHVMFSVAMEISPGLVVVFLSVIVLDVFSCV